MRWAKAKRWIALPLAAAALLVAVLLTSSIDDEDVETRAAGIELRSVDSSSDAAGGAVDRATAAPVAEGEAVDPTCDDSTFPAAPTARACKKAATTPAGSGEPAPPTTSPPTTAPPPPPQERPPTTAPHPHLPTPTDMAIAEFGPGGCYELPPPPPPDTSPSGPVCTVLLSAVQPVAFDGGEEVVVMVFRNCAPGYVPQPEVTDDGTAVSWGCPDDQSWATSEGDPDQNGVVTSQGPVVPGVPSCWFAFLRVDRFDGTDWSTRYVSDAATAPVCVTVDASGAIVG